MLCHFYLLSGVTLATPKGNVWQLQFASLSVGGSHSEPSTEERVGVAVTVRL
jgi:hypothetical protein